MRFLLLIVFSTLLAACGGRRYTASSDGMGNTIKPNERFYVKFTDKFERNDIVAFKYYGHDYSLVEYKFEWQTRCYRMVACSGDKIEVRKGEFFLNDKLVTLADSGKLLYRVLTTQPLQTQDEFSFPEQDSNKLFIYNINLTNTEYQRYRKTSGIVSIARATLPEDHEDFGPMMIPNVGDTIEIDKSTYPLYKNIPHIKPGKHVLNEKLYFLLGDNRYGADDSRYIGFISHSKMVGVVK